MPKSLTLETNFMPVRETREVAGWAMPWEVEGFYEDHEASLRGGVFDLSAWGTLSIAGPDAADFLQRMSTVSFKAFDGTRAVPGGFLTGRAGVIALGWFLAHEKETFHFVVGPQLVEKTKNHVEAFHFAERLVFEDHSSRWAVLGLWAPPEPLRRAMGLGDNANPLQVHSLSTEGMEFQAWRDDCREALMWVRIKREAAASWLEWLRTFGVSLLGHRLFEYHRVRAGVVEAGIETSDRDILLEASAERSVARNKGCYPGQEVIERIFTYGQVNRKILPMQWQGELPKGEPPVALFADGAEAASLVAWERDPAEAFRGVGLAYVRRSHWDFSGEWTGPEGFAAVLSK